MGDKFIRYAYQILYSNFVWGSSSILICGLDYFSFQPFIVIPDMKWLYMVIYSFLSIGLIQVLYNYNYNVRSD